MKTLLIALLGISILSACREDSFRGEPAVIYDYFKIVDASTGEDYFLSNPDEDPENLHVYWRNYSSEVIRLDDITYKNINGNLVFGPIGLVEDDEPVYQIELPNGDIDTIRVEATGDGDLDDIFSFYYNDRLTDVFDFTDGELGRQYASTNAAYNKGELRDLPQDDTYVVTFEK